MKHIFRHRQKIFALSLLLALTACGPGLQYHDPNMDFSSVHTVAVLPFANLTKEDAGAERVRDVFTTMLLASGTMYVIPPGETARGISRANIADPAHPTPEEVKRFASITRVNAVITGVLREYGEIRSGSASSDVISLSLTMMEAQTGKVVWTASTTKGGVSFSDRLFGGGGRPMNDITQDAVNDLLDKLFH